MISTMAPEVPLIGSVGARAMAIRGGSRSRSTRTFRLSDSSVINAARVSTDCCCCKKLLIGPRNCSSVRPWVCCSPRLL